MKKLLLILIFSMFFISLTSAITYKQNTTIQLTGVCDNCTQMNLTKVVYPNGSFALLGELPMTKNGTNYNYSFSDTSTLGKYYFSTCGDLNGILTCDDTADRSFDVTPNGEEFSIPVIVAFGILILLILIVLIMCIYKLFDVYSPMWIITFSAIAYFLILLLLFTMWTFSDNYLYGLVWICKLFQIMFIVCLVLMFPFIIFLFGYILYGMFTKKNINELVAMGYSPEEAKKFNRR